MKLINPITQRSKIDQRFLFIKIYYCDFDKFIIFQFLIFNIIYFNHMKFQRPVVDMKNAKCLRKTKK